MEIQWTVSCNEYSDGCESADKEMKYWYSFGPFFQIVDLCKSVILNDMAVMIIKRFK